MASRLALTLLVSLVAAAAASTDAVACSCASGDPRRMLAQADAAFVGRLVERPSGSFSNSAEPAVYVFEVEQAVKGKLADRVEVIAAVSGASCGIEAERGERIGLFLTRRDGRWHSSLCQQVNADQLLAAARPLPAPTGSGPAALFVGGSFGEARTIALDRGGRTLGYGRGKGETVLLDACPGGARAVEIVRDGSSVSFAVREVRTMRLVRQRPLRLREQLYPTTVDCRAASGENILLFATRQAGPLGVILRISGARSTEVHRGQGVAAVFGKRRAYLTAGRLANRLIAVDLERGSSRQLRAVPTGTGALALAPDGRHLGAVSYSAPFLNAPPSRVLSIDLSTATPSLRSSTLRASNITGRIGWLDKNRLAFLPGGGDREVLRIYDRRLRLEVRLDWPARLGVIRGNTAYGITWGQQARVLRTELPAGRHGSGSTLPSQTIHAFEAVSAGG